MIVQQTVFEDSTPDITTCDMVANLEIGRSELPFLFPIESRKRYAAGNIDAVCFLGDSFERTLNTVVDSFHKTRAELNRQGLARAGDRIADSDTSCFNARQEKQGKENQSVNGACDAVSK